MDEMFEHRKVVEPMTKVEFEDLFADMGIGKGIMQYAQGTAKLLNNTTLDDKQFRQAVRGLAAWCEV